MRSPEESEALRNCSASCSLQGGPSTPSKPTSMASLKRSSHDRFPGSMLYITDFLGRFAAGLISCAAAATLSAAEMAPAAPNEAAISSLRLILVITSPSLTGARCFAEHTGCKLDQTRPNSANESGQILLCVRASLDTTPFWDHPG